MVPVAVAPGPEATWALSDGWLRTTVNVSSPSAKVSPTTLTVTGCCRGRPGRKVSVAVAPVKSSPASAVPGAVAYLTVTGWEAARSRVTVNVNGVTPRFPSGLATPLIPSVGRGSSSVIVPVAVLRATVTSADETATSNVSSGSCTVSSISGTSKALAVSPGLKVMLVAVGRGRLHGHGPPAGGGQGEDERRRGRAGVALLGGGGADVDGRRGVVVDDRAGAGGRGAERDAAGGAGQLDGEGLVVLVEGVAEHVDGQRGRRLVGPEEEGPGGVGEVPVGQRRARVGRVADREGARPPAAAGDREGHVPGAEVALGLAGRSDRHRPGGRLGRHRPEELDQQRQPGDEDRGPTAPGRSARSPRQRYGHVTRVPTCSWKLPLPKWSEAGGMWAVTRRSPFD